MAAENPTWGEERIALGGSLRRECLDFLIPFNERHLQMTIREWAAAFGVTTLAWLLDQSDNLNGVAASYIGEIVAHITRALQGELPGNDHRILCGRACDSNRRVPRKLDQ
jgi:hypothetical protein